MARLNVEGSKTRKRTLPKTICHYNQIGSLVVAFSDEEYSSYSDTL